MRMTCPAPETLIPHALGAADPAVAGHLAGCPACAAEVARLREAAEMLRGPAVLERRTETPVCIDEIVIADFVEGRLGPEVRAPVVAHLLVCSRCRSVVQATGRLLADRVATATGRQRQWLRWSLPLGIAAAAAVLLLLWPRGSDDAHSTPGLRDTTMTSRVTPTPLAPRASVARLNRFVWSSLPGATRYRLRLYDEDGAVLWTRETGDTMLALPDSVVISPRVAYFWKVDAQTEWRRWVPSDLVEFRLVGSSQ